MNDLSRLSDEDLIRLYQQGGAGQAPASGPAPAANPLSAMSDDELRALYQQQVQQQGQTQAEPQQSEEGRGFFDRVGDLWQNPPAGPSLIGTAKAIWEGVTAPGDVYAGHLDPSSDEAVRRSMGLAGAVTLGTTGSPAGALGSGLVRPRPVPAAPAASPLVEAAENIGVSIPRILDSQSTATQRVGSAVSQIPIAGEPLVGAVRQTTDDLGRAATDIAKSYGSASRETAGAQAKQGVADWIKTASRQEEGLAHDAVKDMVTPNVVTPLENTARTLGEINLRRANSARGESPLNKVLEDALNRPEGLNYEGIKDLRSAFGPRVRQQLINQGLDEGEVKLVYGALSRDLENAVRRGGGEEAVTAWRQANATSKLLNERRKALSKIIGEKDDAAPEAVFERIVAMAGSKARGDLKKLMLARKAIGKEGWGEVASAVIARLGRDAEGNFSPERFLGPNGFNGLSEGGKRALFGDNLDHFKALQDLATVSSSIKDKIGRYQNTSRTTGTLLGAAGIAGILSEPVTTLATIAGGRLVARTLAKPAGAKATARWAKAYEKVAGEPNSRNVALFQAASRNLANILGGGEKLAVELQAVVPGRSEDQQVTPSGM